MNNKLPELPANQLEQVLSGVESSESLIHFFASSKVLESLTHLGPLLLSGIITVEKFVPPVKILLSGIMTGAEGVKTFNKLRKKKPTKMRIAGRAINITVPLFVTVITIMAFIFPALLPILTLITITLGLARESFNLFKTLHKHWRSQRKLNKIAKEFETGQGTLSDEKMAALINEHQSIALKHVARQWKIIHRITDVIIGISSLIAITVVLTTGPIGWFALAGVGLIGFGVKVGLNIVKKRRIAKAKIKEEGCDQQASKGQNPTAHSEQTLPSEQEIHSDSHHPHNTKDIMAEITEHPNNHKVQLNKPTHSQVESLAKREAQIFEDQQKQQPEEYRSILDKILQKHNKPQDEDEDEDEEGESPHQ